MRKSRLARALWLLALVLIVSAGFAAVVTLAGDPFPWKKCGPGGECAEGYVCCQGRCKPPAYCQ